MCSTMCSSCAELTFHVQLHMGVQKFCPCPSCSKTFTTESGLKHHVKTKYEQYHKEQESEKMKKKKKENEAKHGTLNSANADKPKNENLGDENEKVETKKDVTEEEKVKESNSTQNVKKNQCSKVEMPSTKSTSKVVKTKKKKPDPKIETKINTDSDEEFRCRPLPIPGDESDEFYDDLVKNVEVEVMGKNGKELRIIFICKMCATTCTRKTDVKHHWKQSCAGNPAKEIICRHCFVKNEKMLRMVNPI